MRLIWTLVKVVIGLAVAIPIAIIVLGTALGALGLLVGLATAVLKLAIVALVALGAVKLLSRLFRGPSPRPHTAAPSHVLPPVDPHYDAAMRELDRELGHAR
jgi:hypothetical protein